MGFWLPKQDWKDQDAYIIGGGHSLRVFDWDLLVQRNTIGCNTAYTLGEDVCKVCTFGDTTFWSANKGNLAKFKNPVVTSNRSLLASAPEWLKVIERKSRGLHTSAVGWNGNTGSMAVNLALLLGARRVFLLGFDMRLDDQGRPNWHDRLLDRPRARVYDKFLEGFQYVARDLPAKFPGCEVVNVTNDSRLNVFPKVSLTDHFGKETRLCESCVQS